MPFNDFILHQIPSHLPQLHIIKRSFYSTSVERNKEATLYTLKSLCLALFHSNFFISPLGFLIERRIRLVIHPSHNSDISHTGITHNALVHSQKYFDNKNRRFHTIGIHSYCIEVSFAQQQTSRAIPLDTLPLFTNENVVFEKKKHRLQF